MNKKKKWHRIVFIIGVIALISGLLDPLEGSVVITAGSILIALSTFLSRDRHWKIFLASFIMIVFGVFFMFYLSTFGGLGPGALSWWWGILVLPYPIAWFIAIITLIVRALKKPQL